MFTCSQGADLMFGNPLFGAVKLTKNIEPDKCFYSGLNIGFDARRSFVLSDGSGFGQNEIIFGADMSQSLHIDNKKKGILILAKGLTDALDDTTFNIEKEYSINFTE